MKYFFSYISFLFIFSSVYGQSIPTITINAIVIGKDSVNIPYNSDYKLVQDSCTEIIRYTHYDFKRRVFYGKIKDVLKNNPSTIVAEGNYSGRGLKNGDFILHFTNGKLEAQGSYKNNEYDGEWVFYYPNGKLQAKGSFKDGKFVGKWETYYDNGQPNLFFESIDGKCDIQNIWLDDGTKLVINGNGIYETDGLNSAHTKGKLVNGMPDSTWTLQTGVGKGQILVTEYFDKGKFIKGHVESGIYSRDYTDETHIILFPAIWRLNITNAELIDFSGTSCNGAIYHDCYVKMFNTTSRFHIITLYNSHAY